MEQGGCLFHPIFFILFTPVRKSIKKIAPYLVSLFLGILYWRTLAPGLSWANNGADGGDLITAVVTGGVPHPTGYPTYLIIASWFLKIPFGSLAFRANVLSAVCTILAAFIVFQIVLGENGRISSALIASLSFGVFPLIWSQALIAEVNALNGLFFVLLLFFFLARSSGSIVDLTGGIVLGLGIGNHLTTLFMLPFMFMNNPPPGKFAAMETRGIQTTYLLHQPWRMIRRLAGLCLGLCIYLVIPFRARSHAPVNWGNAVNWGQFVWLVTGQMYAGRLEDWSIAYLYKGFQVWSRFLLEQLSLVGILLVFVAIFLLFKPTLLYMITGWAAVVYSAFSILYYSPDSYVYLLPVLVVFSIWMGLSSAWLAGQAARKKGFWGQLTLLSILALIGGRAILSIPAMDLSSDRTAEQYAQDVMMSVPENAIVIARGDEATFSLWYACYANHQRADITLVSQDLFVQSWYRQVLAYTYPQLSIPNSSQIQELMASNPGRPICQTEWGMQPVVSCDR